MLLFSVRIHLAQMNYTLHTISKMKNMTIMTMVYFALITTLRLKMANMLTMIILILIICLNTITITIPIPILILIIGHAIAEEEKVSQ
jgi:hypothetical protein